MSLLRERSIKQETKCDENQKSYGGISINLRMPLGQPFCILRPFGSCEKLPRAEFAGLLAQTPLLGFLD